MEWFYFIIWSFSVNNVMVNFFFYRNIYVMYMFVNVYNFDQQRFGIKNDNIYLDYVEYDYFFLVGFDFFLQ